MHKQLLLNFKFSFFIAREGSAIMLLSVHGKDNKEKVLNDAAVKIKVVR